MYATCHIQHQGMGHTSLECVDFHISISLWFPWSELFLFPLMSQFFLINIPQQKEDKIISRYNKFAYWELFRTCGSMGDLYFDSIKIDQSVDGQNWQNGGPTQFQLLYTLQVMEVGISRLLEDRLFPPRTCTPDSKNNCHSLLSVNHMTGSLL